MATAVTHLAGLRFRNQVRVGSASEPTNYYLLLRILDGNSGRPSDAAVGDTLSTNLSEVPTSGTGYSRIAIARTAGVESVVGNDSVITFPAQTFSFTGGVANATHAALATTADNTGVLLASAPLSAIRNFASGDTDTITFKLQDGQHV